MDASGSGVAPLVSRWIFFAFLSLVFLFFVVSASASAVVSRVRGGRESCAVARFLVFLTFLGLGLSATGSPIPLVSGRAFAFLILGGLEEGLAVASCGAASAAEIISAIGFSGSTGFSFLLRLGLGGLAAGVVGSDGPALTSVAFCSCAQIFGAFLRCAATSALASWAVPS